MTGNTLVPGKASETELCRMMDEYSSMLVGICAILLDDRDLAQDVVQETFIRVYKKMDSFRGARPESEKAWLTRIAVNLCRDEKKKKLVSPERTGKAHRHDGDPHGGRDGGGTGAVRGRAGAAEEIPRGHFAVLLSGFDRAGDRRDFSSGDRLDLSQAERGSADAEKDLGRGVNLVDEQKLRNALKACLPQSEFPPERRQAVLRAIRKEEPIVKRKISTALVFAIVMTLIVGGAALAANLGVFGQSVNNDDNEQSVGRLEKLEDVSATYNDTQAVTAPSQSATEAPKTTRDELMASLYNRRFNLTLNQAYYDGYKLYYSYTLTSDCKTGFITGEGMPTGFDDTWQSAEAGKYATGRTYISDDAIQREIVTYFSGHPVGYIAYESMGVGDGADMGGKPLTILDSGEERVNAYTIQGFQEVEMPDGFEPTDEIDIELTVMYGMSVWAQDEKNVYHEYMMTPENRGFFRLPFKVKLNGQTETYTGSVTTSAYSAQATVRVSDVDISGEVVFDAPEWAEAFEASADGKHEMEMPYINSYTLVADGVELQNRDGAFGVNKDGKFFVWIRYDLPESMNSLVLVPNGSGIDYKAKIAAGETPTHENEDIVLLK